MLAHGNYCQAIYSPILTASALRWKKTRLAAAPYTVIIIVGDDAMDCKTKIKELREMTGMNRKDFCKFFNIPYRTVTEWELDNRHAPEYVLRLLEYYIRNEGLIKSPAEQKHAGERSSSHEKTN